MENRETLRTVVIAVAVLALVGTACSSSDDGSTADPAAAAEETLAGDTENDATPKGAAPSEDDGGDSEWDAVVAQAEEEGAVTYYSDQNVVNLEALEAAFEQAYDIDLTFVRGLPTDLNPRVETEFSLGSGEADVYTTADRRWMLGQSGTGNLVPAETPAVTGGDFPDDLDLDDFVVTHGSTVGYGWNTDLVADGISSYEDLLDEDLRGLIGIPEPTAEALVDFYLFLEAEYGEEYVQQLADLEPRVYSGGSAIVEAMTSGEIAATAYGSPIIENNKADGAPVDWGRPEVSWGVPFNTAVLATAPHPAAAQVLVDFILSEEGQTAVGTNYLTVSAIPEAIDTIDSIAPSRAPELSPDDVEAYREKWRSMFQ